MSTKFKREEDCGSRQWEERYKSHKLVPRSLRLVAAGQGQEKLSSATSSIAEVQQATASPDREKFRQITYYRYVHLFLSKT